MSETKMDRGLVMLCASTGAIVLIGTLVGLLCFAYLRAGSTVVYVSCFVESGLCLWILARSGRLLYGKEMSIEQFGKIALFVFVILCAIFLQYDVFRNWAHYGF